jgi:hypothetical protein
MKLFCKHEWEEVKNTIHLYNCGSSKEANFKCCKCGKERWFDIFEIPKNTYIFKEYSKGDISDGYHTFDELYDHRMVLFSMICNTYKDIAWKSWLHEDGTMYEDCFIVGITTPKGDYSYHYHKDYWEKFNVKELKNAPKWDGHLPKDIDRLYSLLNNNYMNKNKKLIKLTEWLKGEKYGYLLKDGITWINYGDLNDEFPYDESKKKWELSRNRMIDKTIKKIEEMIKEQ